MNGYKHIDTEPMYYAPVPLTFDPLS